MNIIEQLLYEDKRKKEMNDRLNMLQNQYVNEMKRKKELLIKLLEKKQEEEKLINKTIDFLKESQDRIKIKYCSSFGKELNTKEQI